MQTACESLNLHLIAPVIGLVVDYARYSEAELVHTVLTSTDNEMFFYTGESTHLGREWMDICTNTQSKDLADQHVVSPGWCGESVYFQYSLR
jgi:hypothetical protein